MPLTPFASTRRLALRSVIGGALLLIPMLLLMACQEGAEDTFRVAVIRYQHETCTFCPGGDTDIEAWTRIRPLLKGDPVLASGSYIRGFLAQARSYGDCERPGMP